MEFMQPDGPARRNIVHDVSIDGPAICVSPFAANLCPSRESIRNTARHCADAVRVAAGRIGGAEQAVPGEEQFSAFVGRQANYQDYRGILGRGLPQADDVSPDYKTQASALLYGDLYDWDNLNQPDSIAEYLRDYY